MSATKIAASFRVSLTALVPKEADSRVAVAWAWLHYHAAPKEDVEAGNAGPACRLANAYPRRAEHNTFAEGRIADGSRIALSFLSVACVSSVPPIASPA
jgi:hypothetical protein